jgi:putative nucleotidyltransferase with HDIG domain
MEQFKQLLVRYFEKILIVIVLLAAFLGTYFLEEKSVVLDFYYLPVLLAGYFLGRRAGLLTAVLSILLVIFWALLIPSSFSNARESYAPLTRLSSWGGFLILSSVAVGTLYEQKERHLLELKHAYIGVLEILAKYLESTDRYTKGHSVRVSEMAMEIAIAMQLPRAEVENIRVAGLLHDIGKIEISGDVLRKAAELTSEEREMMKTHTEKGALLLASVGSVLKDVVPIVSSHHKYFVDATDDGHPNPLTKVPLGARVITVADAFDAMTTDQPYRKGMQPWAALEEILKNSGKQFDPQVVEAFKRVFSEKLEKG